VALQTARALAGTAPLNVLAPAALQAELQAAAGAMELPVTVEPEQWEHLIAGSKSTTLDLVPALGAAGARQHDWQRWRWPLRIALAVVVVNIGALNIEWLRLKREADAVRQSMTQTFKTVYPGQAILDPLAQMQRNIALARANSGQLSPDEFTFLAASLGEALAAAPRPVELATLEYRDGAVKAKVKSGADAALLQQLQATLAGRGLRLTDSGGIWELRSAGGAK
jgi:general secretion pathway protein L